MVLCTPFLTHGAMVAWYMLSSCVRLSVRPSVTSWSSTKMIKPRIMLTMPYDGPGTPDAKNLAKIPMGSPPNWGTK